jgi:hypothetical protein
LSLILLNSNFEVEKTCQYSWNILESVEKDIEYSWNIREYVERVLGYSWSFKAWVEQGLEYSWNISAWVKKQLQYSWNIFATAITSETFVKYEFSSAKRPKAFYINILNKVIGLRAPIICWCRRALSYSWNIDECNCIDISIGYTTQQMMVDQEIGLTVENAIEGCVYEWEIVSGGGYLLPGPGINDIIYHSPFHNENCELNPIIRLSIGENVCDTLAIAVIEENFSIAYKIISACQDTDPLCDPPDNSCLEGWFCCWTGRYDCLGVQYDCQRTSLYSTHSDCTSAPGDTCVAGIYDLRGDLHKECGCCPAVFL